MRIATKQSPVHTALAIGGLYSFVGTCWVLFSDQVVQELAATEAQITLFQSVKGMGFILLSSVLVFGLVYRPLEYLSDRNRMLEASLLHTDLLHRILRHNLRNSCNIIAGYVDLIGERSGEEHTSLLTVIRTQNDRLATLSRKSRHLRHFIDPVTEDVVTQNLSRLVTERVERIRDRFPEAAITIESPPTAVVTAHYRLGGAIEEVVENAVVHNDSSTPEVAVTVRSDRNRVTLTVEDNGPGIPRTERTVLTRDAETPTAHSQGLGLWLVRLTVDYSDGTVTIGESPSGGATVEIALPTA